MTDQEFCRIYSAYYGDGIDKIGQLVQTTMDGEELKELIEFFIKELKTNNMEFKGTKGKWEISIDNNQMILTDSGAYLPNAMHKTYSSNLELKANALLISKAPKMLEMLEKCKTQLILCTLLDRSGQCSEMVDEIEQLIKEATELKSE